MPGDFEASTFTVVRQGAEGLSIVDEPVLFTHVKPGYSLLEQEAAAE